MNVEPNAANLNHYDVRAYKSGGWCIVSGYINPKPTGGGLNLLTVQGVAPTGGRWYGSASGYSGDGGKCYATALGGGATNVAFDLPTGGDWNFLLSFACD